MFINCSCLISLWPLMYIYPMTYVYRDGLLAKDREDPAVKSFLNSSAKLHLIPLNVYYIKNTLSPYSRRPF